MLRGESSLQLAVPRIVALKPKAMQKSFGGNYDRKLFAKLRKLRKSIADEVMSRRTWCLTTQP